MTEKTSKELLPTTVITNRARGSYMTVHEPKPNDLGKLKYSSMVLLPKTDKATQTALKAAIEAAILVGVQKNIWTVEPQKNDKGQYVVVGVDDFRRPVRDGDKELASGKKKEKDREIYEGMLFFNASSDHKPPMLDRDGSKFDPDDVQDQVYSGAFYRFELNFYPYKAKGNFGVAAGLNAIQKIKDGKKLSGGSAGENFGEYNEPDDDSEVTF